MKQEFYFPSSDGQTRIHGIVWRPEKDVKAVLQICHGMVEYIDRYDGFAEYLSERGFCVVGHDHLGHGKSVQSEEELGFFHETHGNQYVITDIHRLRRVTEKEHRGKPYFMMGHSMGSFLLRQYLTMRAEGLAGAIIMGTGCMPYGLLEAGQKVCQSIAAVKGWHYRSDFVNQLGMGGYNKQFEPSDSTKDWITSDDEMRKKYEADPLCSFTFTVNGYYQMFEGMKTLTRKNAMKKIPKNLSVLFVSGAEDPVGSNGEGVRKVFCKYKDAGIQDVRMKLYPKGRHEILNESNREVVYEDLYQWMNDRIQER